MRNKTIALNAFLFLSWSYAGASAAGPPATKPVVGHVAAGYAAPLGAAADLFDPGWSLSGGATFHFSPSVPVGLRLALGYDRFGATKQSLDAGGGAIGRVEEGSLDMTHLAVDAIWEFGGRGRVGGYAGAGIGEYRRDLTLTQTTEVSGLFCDPIDLTCVFYSTGQEIESEDRLIQFGFNVSAAVLFPLPSGSQIFLEARYHRMTSDPATEYIPVVAGFRW